MKKSGFVLGVTGPSGSGKSVFCSFFAKHNCLLLDCDEIYHRLIDGDTPCSRELSLPENFGPGILDERGGVDRKKLGAVVFSPGAEEKLALLNRISHRYVKKSVYGRIRRMRGYDGAVIDAPLLFQAGVEKQCDLTVAVIAPKEIRTSRLLARDGIDRASIERRLDSAPDDSYYVSRADVTVVNDGSPETLEKAAAGILEKLRSIDERIGK